MTNSIASRRLARGGSLVLAIALAWALGVGPIACASREPAAAPHSASLEDLRKRAREHGDSEFDARLLLMELVAPGGDAASAADARKRLDASKRHGLYEDFARGLDDALHGQLATAPEHFLRAAREARNSADPDAELLALFAVERATDLRHNAQGLWKRWHSWVEQSIAEPKRIGWRARASLVNWWAEEAWDQAEKNMEEQFLRKAGCLSRLRLAGPFGTGADTWRTHAAEAPGPWPVAWPKNPISGLSPRVLKTEQDGCVVRADEPVQQGVFYAEAAFTIEQRADVILTARDALAVWVDDEHVLDRSLSEWGSWTRVGVRLTLEPGRHRVVVKLGNAETAVRLLHPDGRPYPARPADSVGFPALTPPVLGPDANPLRRFVHREGVRAPASPIIAYVAAYLAHLDAENEAATMLAEQLVKDPKRATGGALSLAAEFVKGDPIYDSGQAEDLVRELHLRALERDPNLWASDLTRASHMARSKGVVDAVVELERLTQRYTRVPALLSALASIYAELGWTPEYRETVKLHAKRFPDDPGGLYLAAQVYEQEGATDQADALYARVRELDPDSEVLVDRSMEQQRYDVALAELERLHERRPQAVQLARRIEQLKVQAGGDVNRRALLLSSVERDPTNGQARLELADALWAEGQETALQDALVLAIEAGANTAPIKNALDLVQGVTELEPFRLDGRAIIADYEARGEHMPGTAARVLDYMAVWVGVDGSSRYLEHEIIRIQSSEAISRFAEQELRGEMALKVRVIKQDGRVLEPEAVEGKPTVTFPHLEIGDYIETEELFTSSATAQGVFSEGIRWFFREKDVAYARSEFVYVAPNDLQLDIEMTGEVPEPSVTRDGHFTARRWIVSQSPAAPDEPFSVPPTEYLPSLRISWGMGLDRRVQMLADRVADTTPIDPRIVRIARGITSDVEGGAELERARALYRWVLANVQQGEENDGRRVIVGKRGNPWRAFVTLCRAIDIPVSWALVKNRLAPEAKGPASQAEQFGTTVLLVGKVRKPVTLIDKYHPFGYVPAEVRGMPARLLDGVSDEPIAIPADGLPDRLEFRGKVKLDADGTAELDLRQVFTGKFAAGMRQALGQVGERRMKDSIESQILGSNLRGARLAGYELIDFDELDAPLELKMSAKMSHFALARDGGLRLDPPYAPRLSQFASLPARQTPMLLPADRSWRIRFEIDLPEGSRVAELAAGEFRFDAHRVVIRDRVEGKRLILDREVDLPAGRIAPGDYQRFVQFAREADAALSHEVQITR